MLMRCSQSYQYITHWHVDIVSILLLPCFQKSLQLFSVNYLPTNSEYSKIDTRHQLIQSLIGCKLNGCDVSCQWPKIFFEEKRKNMSKNWKKNKNCRKTEKLSRSFLLVEVFLTICLLVEVFSTACLLVDVFSALDWFNLFVTSSQATLNWQRIVWYELYEPRGELCFL